METNLRAADLHLSAEETAMLDQASDLHASDYPYGELGIDQRSRNLAGAGNPVKGRCPGKWSQTTALNRSPRRFVTTFRRSWSGPASPRPPNIAI